MSDKSHVSMEQRVCLVCGRPFETGALLLDLRLRASMERHTITGWDLCPEHRQMHEQGFIALVECDPEKSGQPGAGERVAPGSVYRTGRLAHLKREIFAELFNVATGTDAPCVFVDPDVIATLEKMKRASD